MAEDPFESTFVDATHAYRAGVLTGVLLKWAAAALEPAAAVSPSVDDKGNYLNRIIIVAGDHEFVVMLMPEEDS